MKLYFERPNDYYFLFAQADDQTPLGTAGIYNVEAHRRAEWGRWVLTPGRYLSAASVALTYRMVFDVMKLETLYCRTISENLGVLAFHDHCRLVRVGLQKDAVAIGGRRYDLVVHELQRSQWPNLRNQLERWARMMLCSSEPLKQP